MVEETGLMVLRVVYEREVGSGGRGVVRVLVVWCGGVVLRWCGVVWRRIIKFYEGNLYSNKTEHDFMSPIHSLSTN